MLTVERSRVGWRFWLLWVLASTVGLFLGLVVGFFGALKVSDFQRDLAWAAIAAGAGAGVGIMQWLVLRRQVSRVGWWALASLVGLGVAAVGGVAVALAAGYSMEWFPMAGWIVIAAVGGAMAGIMQWLILRRQVSRAGWWVLASTVGWAVSVAGLVVLGEEIMDFLALGVGLAGIVGLGAMTGLALVWLLRQPAPEA